MTKAFTFRAGARPVFSQARFKDESEGERVCWHISVDPRVARGSVYSHHKPPKDTVQPIKYRPRPIPVPKEEAPEQYEEEVMEDHDFRPDLLEIEDRPIEEDLATAKETYIERPPTPHFVPDEPGVDVQTQVWDGDLFHFDSAVRPMIKVIVQHTLLRALAEVHEEIEVENLQRHRDRYEVERNVILAELQRLEAKEQRKFEEDKRRRNQREAAMKAMSELNNRLASDGFAEVFSVDLALQSMDCVDRVGYFFDEVEREVETDLLPWLAGEIEIALEVKEVLHELKVSAARKAIEIRDDRKGGFGQVVRQKIEVQDQQKKDWLWQSLVEDLGSAKIRKARRDFKEQKEREAAEAIARAEAAEAAAEAAAAEEAERKARGEDIPEPAAESASESETPSGSDT
jgi:hypothetical protein